MDGADEGITDGAPVGTVVGNMVGVSLGDADGALLGVALGDAVLVVGAGEVGAVGASVLRSTVHSSVTPKTGSYALTAT